MLHARKPAMSARLSYGSVDFTSRVEGATPHQLVVILFDELLASLDTMAIAAARGQFATYLDRQSRALAVLQGLDTSLDFEAGGELARGLASIYSQAKQRILNASQTEDRVAAITGVRVMLAEIADAWAAIGQPNRAG
ncbi:MAG: flagellar export chaperone FliS [Sphingopyxis sp.]